MSAIPAGLVALLLLAAACSPIPTGAGTSPSGSDTYHPQPPVQRGGTLVMSDFEYPGTLDPLTAQTDLELRLGGLVFEPLWTFDDHLRPYPGLVREVPTTANGEVKRASDGRSMTVDVRLAPGLRWSDGQPLTAADVIFTLAALRDPATGAAPVNGLDRVKGARRVSDTELILAFDGVYAPYLELGAALFVMPSHRLSTVAHSDWSKGAFFQRPDVGSGPFVVSDVTPGARLAFQANPRYPDGQQAGRHRAYLDGLMFEVQSGRAALLGALRAGSADLAFQLSPDDLPALTGIAGSSPVSLTGLRMESLAPNHDGNSATGRPPPWLNDRRVLDALDHAVDRSELVRQAQAGTGSAARGVFPRALSGFAQGSRIPPLGDAAGARTLLDGAGWAPGPDGVRVKDGQRLQFALTTVCGSVVDDRVMQLLQAQWQQVGAAVSTGCLARDPFLRAESTAAFDMTLSSNGWGPDPNDWAAMVTEPPGQDSGRCEDQPLEDAFDRGASTLDPAARRSIYGAAEREWLSYHCTMPLFEVSQVDQVATGMHNFAPSPGLGLETWNAADWWLSPAPVRSGQ
jgi:peptide/nickel transport system substrate-binding protein